MVQSILAYRKLREEAVTLHHYHPDWSFSKISKKIWLQPLFCQQMGEKTSGL